MVLAQGFQRKLSDEMTELLIMLCNFSLNTLEPKK